MHHLCLPLQPMCVWLQGWKSQGYGTYCLVHSSQHHAKIDHCRWLHVELIILANSHVPSQKGDRQIAHYYLLHRPRTPLPLRPALPPVQHPLNFKHEAQNVPSRFGHSIVLEALPLGKMFIRPCPYTPSRHSLVKHLCPAQSTPECFAGSRQKPATPSHIL